MSMSQDVESDMGIESREGASSDPEVQIGTDKWFAKVVGLPNWGINPLRDLFHLKNGDLLELFQRKVSHKGYQISECKSAKVKARMDELWEPIFQRKQPESGYMPKSFTRAVVSKVLYSTNIDWAKLACAKLKAKSRPTKIYMYLEGGEQLTYKIVILQRLTCEAEEIAEEIATLEEKRERLSRIVQDTW